MRTANQWFNQTLKRFSKRLTIKSSLGWALIAISLLCLPLGVYRPNRIVSGSAITIQSLFEVVGLLGTVALLGLLGAYALNRGGERQTLFPWVIGTFPGLILCGLSWLLVWRSPLTDLPFFTDIPKAARVSPGGGFWVFLIGILLLQGARGHFKKRAAFTLTVTVAVVILGLSPNLSLYKELLNVKTTFIPELLRHMTLAFVSVLVAILPGIWFGYMSFRFQKLRSPIMTVVNFFQVVPTLSLLGLLMIPLSFLSAEIPLLATMGIRGIGFAPAFIVLWLYCLLPLTANALAGFEQIETSVIASALAMGMTQRQLFWRVLLPLAAPLILAGIRTATTQNIGNTILAGLIGGGGMGALIFLGLSQSASDLVILGTLPVVLMALLADSLFEILEHFYKGRQIEYFLKKVKGGLRRDPIKASS